MSHFENSLFIDLKLSSNLPEGKGVKDIILYSPKGQLLQTITIKPPQLLFEFIPKLNKEINKYENIVFITLSYKRGFENWYKTYFGINFPQKFWERKFIYSPNSFDPPLDKFGSINDIAEKVINGKIKLRKNTDIIKVDYRGLFLPEVRTEIIDILKEYEDEELPLKLPLEKVFTEETLKFWNEFKEKAQELEKLAGASQISIKEKEEEKVETQLKTYKMRDIGSIIAKFLYIKYLELSKEFPAFYEKFPISKLLIRYLPIHPLSKSIAKFLSLFLEKTDFEYSFKNCEIFNPQYAFLYSFLQNKPIPPKWETKPLKTLLKEYKTYPSFENFMVDLIIASAKEGVGRYEDLEKMNFIPTSDIKDMPKKIKEFTNALKEVLRKKNAYFKSFEYAFNETFLFSNEKLLSLPQTEFKELECTFFRKVENFNPTSNSILYDLIMALPDKLKEGLKIKGLSIQRNSLIGIYLKMFV